MSPEEQLQAILNYFPSLSERQKEQLHLIGPLYEDWNRKINVISRKDMDHFYLHHVLHSLSIARVLLPEAGASVMDLGSGGGFPGIPLAILFPECRFHLVDSIQKKLLVASEVAREAGICNVTFSHCRAEEEKGRFDYVVSRAVMSLTPLWKISRCLLRTDRVKGNLPSGLVCLKGGDLDQEIATMGRKAEAIHVVHISSFFHEEFFDTKKIVYVPM